MPKAYAGPQLSAEAAARLRRRYPRPRMPRPLLVGLTALLAVAGLAFVAWSGSVHSNPPVAGEVTAYTVQTDTRVAVTLTVDRPDPAVPATCRVIAQATDFTVVGEQQVPVPPTAAEVVDLELILTTLRRATSASVRECST